MKTTAFKNTDIGPIPADWEVKSFDETFEHIRSKPYQVQATEYQQGGRYPVVDQGQLEIVGYSDNDKKLFHVPDGGVIIFGDHTRIIKFRKADFVVGADGTQLLIGKNDNTQFLFYGLNQVEIPNLGYSRHFKYVKEGHYAIPPLPEQRRIAAALSDADELVASLDKLIEKKKRVKEGAMQRLLSGETRLPGFTGKWGKKKLGECSSIARGGSPRPIEMYLTTDPTGVNWIKIGDVGDDAKYIESTSERIVPEGASHSRLVASGDLILSNSMSYGRPYILKIDGCIHDGWLVIQKYSDTFDTEFLYYGLRTSAVTNQYQALAAGSSVHNLNKELVENVVVLAPPTIAEQRAIAAVLSDMDAEIAALSRERAEAERIKQGMMQELLTGKTRLAEGE